METLTLPSTEQAATAEADLTVALAEAKEALTSDRSFTGKRPLLTSISAFRYIYQYIHH